MSANELLLEIVLLQMNIVYNMADVYVATGISTIHEQSSIDLHTLRKLKKVIHISRNHIYEIAKLYSIWMS